MAMLKYEVCIDKDDKAHGHLLEIGPINGDQMHLDYQLRWDVRRWLDESIPGVTEWVNDMGYDRHGRSEVYVLITFPSKEAATLFKMWWM